jgi:hypothetical protein
MWTRSRTENTRVREVGMCLTHWQLTFEDTRVTSIDSAAFYTGWSLQYARWQASPFWWSTIPR